MIELQNVTKKFGATTALQPANLAFEEGKCVALIGPSGCGKSTLLRIILGLIPPSTGQVLFDGKPVTDWQSTRRRMGFVVQDGGLFPHLTAFQNVAIMAHHLGWDRDRIAKRVEELCSLTAFPIEAGARYPAELSGGQKQRLSLMRSLMLDPEVLLLDEPLGALDPMVRSALQTDLKAIFDKLGQTVIFVTHDMAEAGFLGQEIVLMNQGAVVQRGTLDDLRNRPANDFVNAFMNAQRSLTFA